MTSDYMAEAADRTPSGVDTKPARGKQPVVAPAGAGTTVADPARQREERRQDLRTLWSREAENHKKTLDASSDAAPDATPDASVTPPHIEDVVKGFDNLDSVDSGNKDAVKEGVTKILDTKEQLENLLGRPISQNEFRDYFEGHDHWNDIVLGQIDRALDRYESLLELDTFPSDMRETITTAINESREVVGPILQDLFTGDPGDSKEAAAKLIPLAEVLGVDVTNAEALRQFFQDRLSFTTTEENFFEELPSVFTRLQEAGDLAEKSVEPAPLTDTEDADAAPHAGDDGNEEPADEGGEEAPDVDVEGLRAAMDEPDEEERKSRLLQWFKLNAKGMGILTKEFVKRHKKGLIWTAASFYPALFLLPLALVMLAGIAASASKS